MDYKKVKEAFETISNALEDKEFQKWLEGSSKGVLAYDYDHYQINCAESFEEPQGFDEWALWIYVYENTKE